jgi:hypothetical protein
MQLSSNLAVKYQTKMKVNGNDKHTSLVSRNINGRAHFKNVNNYFNTNIYSYLETSGGQSSYL